MKVAFVLPFAFERYFHDASSLFISPENFENEIISKRNTWHFNWCTAMRSAGIEVVFFHISLYRKSVRVYHHCTGIQIISVPTNFRSPIHNNEISFTLLKEINKYNPDIIFSVTHILDNLVDMYDILTFYYRKKGPIVIARNPGADTYDFIFNKRNNIKKRLESLDRTITINHLVRKIYLITKLIPVSLFCNIKFYLKKKSFKYSSLIIPQTQKDFDTLYSKFRVSPERIKMLPKPLDTITFREIPKNLSAKKLGMDESYKYLLHVSNLYSTKGCEHIIELLPELIRRYTKVKLIVTGGGMKKDYLEQLVNKMNLKENVIFMGHVDYERLVFLYNIADVFVLPTERSVGEGIPNVILESIACNTVPVSTKIPGPAEIINEDNGILVEIGNNNALLHALIDVIDGKFKINEKSRKRLLKAYSIENTGYLLKKIFVELTSDKLKIHKN